MNILVSGSIAHDSIMNFPDHFKNHILSDKIHSLSVSFLIDDMKVNYGGTAGNIAYSLALLEERPTIISTAGNDFGEYKKWLNKNNIKTDFIKIIKNELTGLAHIITDLSDNQITAFYPGSMKYSGGEIKKDLLENAIAIVAPGFKGDMTDYPRLYKKNNIPYIFDPGQQIPALSAEELRESITSAKAFISNDYELSLVLAKTGWDEGDILNQVEILVTTLGEKGSVVKTKKEKFDIPPAKPQDIKDPTGAGDAYRAGFIKGLINNYPMDKTGKLASLVSVYAVENYGTQNHKFSWGDVQKRYRENFGDNI